MTVRVLLVSTSALAGLFVLSQPAFAQVKSASLDEIVVTAQKRSENLQSTPLSIAAFGEARLNDLDIKDPEALAEVVPNVSIGDGTGQGKAGAQISIRGVNEARVSPVLDPAVGIYIDDVYFGRPQTAFLKLLDVERVEVLRGPQGTLFGKNAVGGAIRYITKRPDFDSVSGYGEFVYGSRDRTDFEGAINLPVSDILAFRLSGGYLKEDGFVKRQTDGVKLGNEDTYSLNAKARFQPNDRLDVNLGVDYSKSDTDNGPQKLIDYAGYNGNGVPVTIEPGTSAATHGWNRYFGGTNLEYNPDIPLSLYEVGGEGLLPVNEVETIGAYLDITYDLSENTSIRSISGYRNVDQYTLSDFSDDAPAVGFLDNEIRRELNFWSTELQINGSYFNDRLDWVGGAYYSDEEPSRNEIKNSNGGLQFLVGPPSNPSAVGYGPGFAGHLLLNDDALQKTKSLGFYTQGTFDVTEKFALTAGVRYTEDDKSYTISQRAFYNFDLAAQAAALGLDPISTTNLNPATPNLRIPLYNGCAVDLTPEGCVSQTPLTGGETFTAWTPRFAAEYQANDNLMMFASVSKGYKAGGTNDSVADIDTPFSPETLTSYEAGIRSEFFDNRFRFNITGFYSNYNDKQITVANSPICTNRCTTNVGDAIIKGVEIETQAALDEHFSLFGNFGYLDAAWDEITNASAGVTLGSPFSRAPKFTSAIGFRHTYDLSNEFYIQTTATVTYKDEQVTSPQDSTRLTLPDYTLVSGRVSLSPDSDSWKVSLFCTNCFNEEYVTGGAGWAGSTDNTPFNYASDVADVVAPPSISYVNVGAPRAYGIEIRKEF